MKDGMAGSNGRSGSRRWRWRWRRRGSYKKGSLEARKIQRMRVQQRNED
jgi:hypothetical protein